jgi:hypothetical protein
VNVAALSEADIKELVRGLDRTDWVQVRLIANLPPERRLVPGLQAQAFALAAVRGELSRRYPDLSSSAINMRALKHFTPVQLPQLWPPP